MKPLKTITTICFIIFYFNFIVSSYFRMDAPLIAKNLQYPIHCVSVTPDGSHIFACIEDGNIIVLGP